YSTDVKKYTKDNNTGLSDAVYLNQLEDAKKEEFKKAVLDYSNSLTDFENAEDASGNKGIENIFKKSLDDAKLDLDGNGTNDFVDIKTIINRVDGIAKNINKTFGDKNAIEGDISKQGIRRMILLMFVMSIFEASDWDFRRQEADLTKYMDSSIAE
ncbi:MAG: hypothetical protein LW817_05830, partial [Candidatus Caenarcaniphilales bacterium]|nr:hypothetical protein [Candidatus Caenarcaniphilales bacterium]